MLQVHDDVASVWSVGAYEAEGTLQVAPKASLACYSWDELKSIARAHCLVDDDLKLRGDTKGVVLEDGTAAEVRILGFRHDHLADAAGKAGISFEFADVPTIRRMNAEWTNVGGWAKSEMRDWLNSVFFGMLPQDLSANIVEVEKKTICRDGVGTLRVMGTYDTLWLLSMKEVYGALSGHRRNVPSQPGVYAAEGTQYQLYADNDVSIMNYEFCQKQGANSWWWLRSPHAYNSDGFHGVDRGGVWHWVSYAYDDWGVSPGFCF